MNWIDSEKYTEKEIEYGLGKMAGSFVLLRGSYVHYCDIFDIMAHMDMNSLFYRYIKAIYGSPVTGKDRAAGLRAMFVYERWSIFEHCAPLLNVPYIPSNDDFGRYTLRYLSLFARDVADTAALKCLEQTLDNITLLILKVIDHRHIAKITRDYIVV